MGQKPIDDLPAVPLAQITDKLAAAQGGTTYKESLQQIATLYESALTSFTGLTGIISSPTAILGAPSNMSVRANVNAADSVTFEAYDTDGLNYSTFGTLTSGASPSFTLTGSSVLNVPNANLSISDDDASAALSFRVGSDLSSDRTFTLTTGDSDRSLDLSGDFNVSGGFDLTFNLSADSTLSLPQSGTLLSEVVQDLSPELGANLSTGGFNIEFDSDNYYRQQLNSHEFVAAGSVAFDADSGGVRIGGANSRVNAIINDSTMSSAGSDNISTSLAIKSYVDSAAASGDFDDATFTIYNNADPSKILDFSAAAIASGTSRTIIMSDQDIDLTPDSGSYQSSSASLLEIAGLSKSDGNIIVGDGAAWVAESGATARASLGLGSVSTQDSSSVSLSGGAIDGVTLGTSSAITEAQIDDININGSTISNLTGLVNMNALAFDVQASGATKIEVSSSGVRFGDTGARITHFNDGSMSGGSSTQAPTENSVKNYVSSVLPIPTSDFTDDVFRISNKADLTKKISFDASGISAASVRTITMPDFDLALDSMSSQSQSAVNIDGGTIDAVTIGGSTKAVSVTSTQAYLNTGSGASDFSALRILNNIPNINTSAIHIESGSTTSYSNVSMSSDTGLLFDVGINPSGATSPGDAYVWTYGASDIRFGTLGVERATLTSGGTFEILNADIGGGEIDGATLGTNSPITEAQIDNININGSQIANSSGDLVLYSTNEEIHLATDNVDVEEYIRHYNDTDTHIRFTTNNIELDCGGVNSLELGSSSVEAKVNLTCSGGASPLKLAGADHVYAEWYPSGISGGRKGYAGFASPGSTTFALVNQNASGNVDFTPGSGGAVRVPSGYFDVNGYIRHVGDVDTSHGFFSNSQNFYCGGVSALDLASSGARLGGSNSRVSTILDQDNMSSNSSTALATQQSIKAYVDTKAESTAHMWCSYEAVGTVSIIDSYNVASVTDNGTGDQTVNISTDFANANYCPVSMGRRITANQDAIVGVGNGTGITAGTLQLRTSVGNGTFADFENVWVAAFGELS